MDNINNEIKEDSYISDERNIQDFKNISFSKYKKSEVIKKLIENMYNERIEPSCYWSCELICSGHYLDIWETIFYYVGKYIHIGNPKLVLYLENRYKIFKNIIKISYKNELLIRNNITIRKLFGEIITVLTLSPKKNSYEQIKINNKQEFNVLTMTDKFKACSTDFIKNIFLDNDPMEVFIPCNELSYNIQKKNNQLSCYWIEWLIEFDIICRKKKQPCICKTRLNEYIENKYQTNIIWLIWDILFYCSSLLENNIYILNVLKSAHYLFSIKYTIHTNKKRKYLLYFCILILTEHIDNIELFTEDNKLYISNVVDKINEIYKQIKKNEINKNKNLYKNKNLNLQDSLRKFQLLDNVYLNNIDNEIYDINNDIIEITDDINNI